MKSTTLSDTNRAPTTLRINRSEKAFHHFENCWWCTPRVSVNGKSLESLVVDLPTCFSLIFRKLNPHIFLNIRKMQYFAVAVETMSLQILIPYDPMTAIFPVCAAALWRTLCITARTPTHTTGKKTRAYTHAWGCTLVTVFSKLVTGPTFFFWMIPLSVGYNILRVVVKSTLSVTFLSSSNQLRTNFSHFLSDTDFTWFASNERFNWCWIKWTAVNIPVIHSITVSVCWCIIYLVIVVYFARFVYRRPTPTWDPHFFTIATHLWGNMEKLFHLFRTIPMFW